MFTVATFVSQFLVMLTALNLNNGTDFNIKSK